VVMELVQPRKKKKKGTKGQMVGMRKEQGDR
jgi:hypothetical protein